MLPIGLEGKTLHLAVIQPRHLSSLSGSTGCKIVPYVAPEIEILRAMERYYGIARRRRYIELSSTIERARSAAGQAPGNGSNAGPCIPERPSGVSPIGKEMSRVDTHWELAELIVNHVSRRLPRSIFFEIRGEEARVVAWNGDGLDGDAMDQSKLAVSPESIFATALGDSYYRGPVPEEFDCGSFYGELAIGVPREFLLLPIYGEERLEAVLYGDGGQDGKVEDSAQHFVELSNKIALAMKMLSLKLQLCAPLGYTGI